MAKKSFLGAAGVAASFITVPQEIEEKENEKKFNEIKNETKLERPEIKETEKVKEDTTIKTESKKEETKVVKTAPVKRAKENEDEIVRATYKLTKEMAKQIQIEAFEKEINARDIITDALNNFNVKSEQVHPINGEGTIYKTYLMYKEEYDHLRKVAFNNDMNASDIIYSALLKYFNK